MKVYIKSTRQLTKEELAELRENVDVELTIEYISETPIPTWNPYFKVIEIDWKWFKGLFKAVSGYDVHVYVTSLEDLHKVGITKYYGLYSIDNDTTYEFWIGASTKLRSTAKKNGFRTNFAYTFCHELAHGRERAMTHGDRTHVMCEQGRLKELLAEHKVLRMELLKEQVSLYEKLLGILRTLSGRQYSRPLPNHWGNISQPYCNPDPKTYTQSGVHPGVDFPTPMGTPVLAPFDGEITRSSYSGELGNWVEFKFDDYYLIALHLANVQKPRQVKRNEPIGFIGSTGLIRGVHAHLELWKQPMDRALLTSEAAVRQYTHDITDIIR